MRRVVWIPLLLSACWSGGERKPLFGGDDTKLGSEPVHAVAPPPASRPLKAAPGDALLLRLQQGDSEERTAALAELVARGDAGRAELEAARDQALLLHDLLAGVLDGSIGRAKRGQAAGSRELAWQQGKYQLALDRWAQGDLWGALRLAEALLAIEPAAELAQKLSALRRQVRAQLLRESLLRAELRPVAVALTPGRELKVALRLVSQASEPVTVVADPEGLIGVLSLVYEELSPAGARTRTLLERTVQSPSDELELAPGEAWEMELVLPAPHADLPAGTVGRYQLGGRLRAGRLEMAGASYSVSLPFFPTEVVVIEAAHASLLALPPGEAFLGALKAAHAATREERGEAARRVFAAAMLLARADPDSATAVVAESLPSAEGPLADALCSALARTTGEPLAYTREEWMRWWAERRGGRPGEEKK